MHRELVELRTKDREREARLERLERMATDVKALIEEGYLKCDLDGKLLPANK